MPGPGRTRRPPDPERLLALIRGGDPRALWDVTSLARKLRIPHERRETVRRALDALVRKGALRLLRGRWYVPAERADGVVGRYVRHPAGFGFVVPDDPREVDLFVPPGADGGALHGDLVVADVVDVKPDGRREGAVRQVFEPPVRRLVGRFVAGWRGAGLVEPLDRQLELEIRVPAGATNGAESGELVTVELVEGPDRAGRARGEVVERLGRPESAAGAIAAVLARYGFSREFPDEVVEEADRRAASARAEIRRREDFRALTVVTIDGADAKDFDDAISVERLRGGGWRLHVFIADVAFMVRPGGALDREALRRGTSVYFPGLAVPMLPPRLSEDVCSLRPHLDRLTQGVTIEIGRGGGFRSVRFHDGVIRSAARLTYEQVNAHLAGHHDVGTSPAPEVARMLADAASLARTLLRARRRRGALDLDMPEPRLELGIDGSVRAIALHDRGLAERMIEEFMVAANRAVAAELDGAPEPALFRVHERPDPRRLERLRDILEPLGYDVPVPSRGIRPGDLAPLLEMSRGRPEQPFVHRQLLRSLSLARYDPECLGHFGLALSEYTHFTSPIRRYPDLVVHRALRRLRSGAKRGRAAARREFVELAAVESSRLEREAEAAEREARAWLVAQFMAGRVGDPAEGIVVDIGPFGLVLALDEPPVEATLPIERLGVGRVRFDPRKMVIRSPGRGPVYRLGQRLEVIVDRVDPLTRRVEVAPVEPPPRRRADGGRGRRSAARKRSPRRRGGRGGRRR
ncbi:MAG: ribonuclease R [Acidobacteriota bacterium]